MRAAIAIALIACLAACIKPLTADSVELAWERCGGGGLPAYRLSQCSQVISFEGTTPQRRASALIIRGSIRSSQGEYPRALADLGRALRLDGDNAQIYVERGIVHQAQGAYEIAVRDFDRALALQPGLPSALQLRAEALEGRTTAFRRQLQILNDQLTRAPRNANLLNERCWLRTVNNEDLDAALVDCNASLEVEPNDANVHDSRGLVYFKRGDYTASLADYETAVRLEPENGHFLYGRGLARLGLGQTAEGNADMLRAEELEPGVRRQYHGYNITMPGTESAAQDAKPDVETPTAN